MKLLPGSALLAGCAVVAVAGCGSAPVPGSLAPGASRSSSPVPSSSPASTMIAAHPTGTSRQRAIADAASILASFVPPPGARRLATAPDADGGALSSPWSTPGSASLVQDTSWWQAPGEPAALLAWEKARLPRRFTLSGTGYGGTGGVTSSWDDSFSLTPVPGVLASRELLIEAVGAGHGQTAFRVDAQVIWQPARSAAERVPAGARLVTITALPSLLPGSKRPPAPVTITDPAVTARIASLVNGLSLPVFEYASCPIMTGGGIRLTFRARPGGPELAVADSAGACDTVLFSIGGRQQPALAGSASLVKQVLTIAGLHWAAD